MPAATDTASDFLVPPDALRSVCKALTLDSSKTDKVDQDDVAQVGFGQQRAIDAIRFAVQMDRGGYNLFVLGSVGSGRRRLVDELARHRATAMTAPDDWCYVNNFTDSERPSVLRFPAGQGAGFRDDMQALIEEMQIAISAAFDGDDYRNQLKAIEQETQDDVKEQWQSLDDLAAKKGIGVLQTPTGYVLAPVSDGKVVNDKEFEKLPESQREKIQASIDELSEELKTRIETMPLLRRQLHDRVRALDREVTANAVKILLVELKEKYRDIDGVLSYLDDVQKNIIDNAQDFRQPESQVPSFLAPDSSQLFARYEVNLVVGNDPGGPAPVIYEPNPTYPNLIGQVEHRAEMGALVTDFRLIRAGALQSANGGYLILDAHRVLNRPFVWEALKQTLYAGRVRIESPGETLGFVGTTTLKPEPIPTDVKIILIGERWLYYLLSRYDKEFSDLFKVAADLDDELDRSDENVESYARLIIDRAEQLDLLPLDLSGVRRVVEQRSRQAEDSERLSMHMRSLDDLLTQADYWARQRSAGEITAGDVVEAIRQRNRRHSRIQSRVIDSINRDTLLIDTSGEYVGQVNGLSVVDLGELRYGHPVRITATTRIGTGEVIDVEREVELGGAIHSKGMLILSSALSARYAPDRPLSLHGSVVFEQSYGGVDGDSASVAELCALLSSISGLPIRQNIAVTGSINQHGRVQVVGGINEKIEGFFDVCKARGLDGSHGVMIPRDNVKHLMLREEVVEAVREHKFNVYAVEKIDDAIEILTGTEAGKRDEKGRFPSNTINRKVEDQLIRYAEQRLRFKETTVGHDSQR